MIPTRTVRPCGDRWEWTVRDPRRPNRRVHTGSSMTRGGAEDAAWRVAMALHRVDMRRLGALMRGIKEFEPPLTIIRSEAEHFDQEGRS